MNESMDIMKQLFLEGYASVNMNMGIILGCVICTLVLAIYVFVVYKWIHKNEFYNKNFNLSLIALAVITAAVILTIQSNIVVSLGMVGALSIVRFRTAIKDPLDLVFLFWSIGIGIICGAGFAAIAVITSIALTIVIFIFSNIHGAKESQLLVVNADTHDIESQIMEIVEEHCDYVHLRAKTMSKNDINLAIEVKVKDQKEMMDELVTLKAITSLSLLEHDGEVTV